MKAKVYWLHSVTPLHVGSGRGVGYIDLPVAREKVTGWPVIPGSGVKGVMRDYFENQQAAHLRQAFGQAENESEGSGNGGSLVFTDARIVLLPVRSLYGTFAWVTSPLALQRLQRDLTDACVADVPQAVPVTTEKALITSHSQLKAPTGNQVYLEDLDFVAEHNPQALKWAEFIAAHLYEPNHAWHEIFAKRFLILPDQHFNYLSEFGTEVNARIRISDQSKTVVSGQLWYEESLPAETILAGVIWCDRVYGGGTQTQAGLLDQFCREPIVCQIGGKASTGKGRIRCLFTK